MLALATASSGRPVTNGYYKKRTAPKSATTGEMEFKLGSYLKTFSR